jgi:hypothetical protein
MAKYRKKPVVIDAEQWDGISQIGEIKHYFDRSTLITEFSDLPTPTYVDYCKQCGESFLDHGWIETLEGGLIVCPGDWIITGVKGEKYPCKPDIFELTYEKGELKNGVALDK